MEKLYTLEEAAEYLRVHIDTAREYCRTGKLKAYKINDWEWRIKQEDLEAFLKEVQDVRAD